MKFKQGDIIKRMEKDLLESETIYDYTLNGLVKVIAHVENDCYYFKTNNFNKDGSYYEAPLSASFIDLHFEKTGEFKNI